MLSKSGMNSLFIHIHFGTKKMASLWRDYKKNECVKTLEFNWRTNMIRVFENTEKLSKIRLFGYGWKIQGVFAGIRGLYLIKNNLLLKEIHFCVETVQLMQIDPSPSVVYDPSTPTPTPKYLPLQGE
jgi:hypothetical protein